MQDPFLDLCKTQIEEKLGWGPAAGWTSQDFEELSVRMQDATGQVISATTLKRIWGRVSYDSSPSRHSLDTLVRFLGHPSWRTYTEVTRRNSERGVLPEPSIIRRRARYAPALILSLFMLFLGAATVIWLGIRHDEQEQAPEGATVVRFASRALAYDLPNTVIFEYDLHDVKADSFFIQQSWDMRLRKRISPENSAHSSTYFYPGYFSAKLIADDVILKEHPVHVKTESWVALLEENPVPVYLPEEALLNNGTLAVSKAWLEAEGFDIDGGDHVLGYYYVQDFGPVRMDNFSLEAIVMHEKVGARRPCQGGQITVRGEDGMIRFPFDIPGCTGVMRVIAGDVHHAGESHDLSALGADYSTWKDVRLAVEDKSVRIQIGTNQPYTFAYTYDMGKVVGVWFQFVGRGMIDEIQLRDNSQRVIYEEAF